MEQVAVASYKKKRHHILRRKALKKSEKIFHQERERETERAGEQGLKKYSYRIRNVKRTRGVVVCVFVVGFLIISLARKIKITVY